MRRADVCHYLDAGDQAAADAAADRAVDHADALVAWLRAGGFPPALCAPPAPRTRPALDQAPALPRGGGASSSAM